MNPQQPKPAQKPEPVIREGNHIHPAEKEAPRPSNKMAPAPRNKMAPPTRDKA
jgi:hypothetical protein